MEGSLLVGRHLKDHFKILDAIVSQESPSHCCPVPLVISTGVAHINQVVGVKVRVQHHFQQSALIRIKNGGHTRYGRHAAFAIEY